MEKFKMNMKIYVDDNYRENVMKSEEDNEY